MSVAIFNKSVYQNQYACYIINEKEKMAKTKAKKEKEVTLETIMWNCRVVMRNKCGKSANRDAVLALGFLKFAGDKFEQRRQEINRLVRQPIIYIFFKINDSTN